MPEPLPHYLIEFLIVHLCPVQLRRMRSMPARPRFSTSRQRPVPLFMMAPFCRGRGARREERREVKIERNMEMFSQHRSLHVAFHRVRHTITMIWVEMMGSSSGDPNISLSFIKFLSGRCSQDGNFFGAVPGLTLPASGYECSADFRSVGSHSPPWMYGIPASPIPVHELG